MLKTLTEIYRTSSLKSRATIALALIIVASLIAYQFEYNAYYVLGGSLTLFLLSEGIFFYRRYLKAVVTAALFLLLGSMFVGAIYMGILTASADELTPESQQFALISVAAMEIILLISVIISAVASFTLTRGRAWMTILLAGVAYLGTFLALMASGSGLSFVFISLISLGALLLMLGVRLFLPRYKTPTFDVTQIPTSKASTVVKDKVSKKLGEEYEEVALPQDELGSFAFKHAGRLYYVTPLAPERSFKVFKRNTLMIDGRPLTGLLEANLMGALSIAREEGIKSKHVVPLLYVKNYNELGKLTTVRVSTKNYPDKPLGALHIVTPDGFYNLLNRNAEAPVKTKA